MNLKEHREWQKKWYAKNKDKINKRRRLARKNGLKLCQDKAQQTARVLQERGLIPILECVFCGSKEYLIKHHSDYTQPLKITIMCRRCHKILHNGRKDIFQEIQQEV